MFGEAWTSRAEAGPYNRFRSGTRGLLGIIGLQGSGVGMKGRCDAPAWVRRAICIMCEKA